jgi:hypothetical protein
MTVIPGSVTYGLASSPAVYHGLIHQVSCPRILSNEAADLILKELAPRSTLRSTNGTVVTTDC